MRTLNPPKDLDQRISRIAKQMHPVFEANRWTWHGATTSPSVSEIKKSIWDLLFFARLGAFESDNETSVCSSGRIRVIYELASDTTPTDTVDILIEFDGKGPESQDPDKQLLELGKAYLEFRAGRQSVQNANRVNTLVKDLLKE